MGRGDTPHTVRGIRARQRKETNILYLDYQVDCSLNFVIRTKLYSFVALAIITSVQHE